jgi:rubrerythrin
MADWTIEEVLRRALQLELENFGEYKRGAEESTIPSMKAMFAFLAEEEKRHIKLIRDKMEELKLKE